MERLVTMDKLDLVVLGQVQYNFTVGGVSGQDLGYAALTAVFRRATAIDRELSAMSAAVSTRTRALEALGEALAVVNAAVCRADPKSQEGVGQKISPTGITDAIKQILVKYNVDLSEVTLGDEMTLGELQKLQARTRFALDKENNAMQSNTATVKSVMSKHDAAVKMMAKVQKRVDGTANTIIATIG